MAHLKKVQFIKLGEINISQRKKQGIVPPLFLYLQWDQEPRMHELTRVALLENQPEYLSHSLLKSLPKA